MHSDWKIYAFLFVLLAVSQSTQYRERLRHSLGQPPSIQPLRTSEIVISSFALFVVFVLFEALVRNDVF